MTWHPPRIFEWPLDPSQPAAKASAAGRRLWVGSSFSLKDGAVIQANFLAIGR